MKRLQVKFSYILHILYIYLLYSHKILKCTKYGKNDDSLIVYELVKLGLNQAIQRPSLAIQPRYVPFIRILKK